MQPFRIPLDDRAAPEYVSWDMDPKGRAWNGGPERKDPTGRRKRRGCSHKARLLITVGVVALLMGLVIATTVLATWYPGNRHFKMTRRDATRRDATRRDATRRDATRRDATRRDATRRDATRRDATRRDATRRDATRRDATRRDATRRDATRRDATRRDATRRDATRRDATRRDATRRDATRRDATRRDATRRDATRHETFIRYFQTCNVHFMSNRNMFESHSDYRH